jgi:hypothetical protein
MSAIDIALVVLLLLCALRGSWRGLFREAFGFAALIGGLLAALRGAEPAAAWLGTVLPVADVNPTAVLGVAFVGVFLVVSTLINLLGVAADQVLGRGALRIPSRWWARCSRPPRARRWRRARCSSCSSSLSSRGSIGRSSILALRGR